MTPPPDSSAHGPRAPDPSESGSREPELELTCRASFCAALRLHAPELDDAENRRLYGVCNNPHGHGHDFTIEVTVRGPVPRRSGLVMDLVRLQALLREEVVEPLDHRHLNRDVEFLRGVNPTLENLAVVLWERLERRLKGAEPCRLHRVRMYETPTSWVDYAGPVTA